MATVEEHSLKGPFINGIPAWRGCARADFAVIDPDRHSLYLSLRRTPAMTVFLDAVGLFAQWNESDQWKRLPKSCSISICLSRLRK
jgi:hypothetical protein